MLHESDLRKFQRCEKYYALSKQKSVSFLPFVTVNQDLYDLVIDYLSLENVFKGERGDECEKTLEAYHAGKNLVNARISYRNFRINIPCLVQTQDKKILYLCYQHCFPKLHEVQKVSDLLQVMEKNKIQVDEILMIHVNASYVRQEEFEVSQCLTLSDSFYNDRNHPCMTLREALNECNRDLDEILDKIEALEDVTQLEKKRSGACTSHYKCEFFNECFPDNHHDTSILNLVQSSKKYECEERGIVDMAMVHGDEIEGSRVQYAQVMAAKKRGQFIDKLALRSWLNKIQEPITYLDFEWQTYVYPPYIGMKPYDVLVFQYSMHIEKDGQLKHEQFVGRKDCRIEFIEDLLSKIPKDGTILVFNAQGAEALRLMQLAKQYPQYASQLQEVWERMVDLAIPFSNGLFYDTRMAGEYNLKKLLSLFSPYSYDDLSIHEGLMAVKKYREYEETGSDEILEQLYAYCGMDTYAEVVLYHYLKEKAKE